LRLIGTVAAALFVVWWAAGLFRHLWAPSTPSPSHPYAVRFKGGQVFYFAEPVGVFMEYFLWFYLAVVVSLVVWNSVLARRAKARE
jgi:hypothetical protein